MELIYVSDVERKRIQVLELQILDELDRICRKHGIKYMVSYGTLIGAIRHNGYIPWDDDVDVCMLRSDYIKFKKVCKQELNHRFFYQSHDTDPEYYYLFDKIRLNGTVFRESFVSKYDINHGVYIDLLPVDYVPENKILRNLQFLIYQFFRMGVHSKYLMLEARTGKKKFFFSILKIFYKPFDLDYLYNGAIKMAVKYDDKRHLYATNFNSVYHQKDTFRTEMYESLEEHIFEKRSVWIPKYYDEFLRTLYGDYRALPPEKERNTRHSLTELKLDLK